MQLEKIKKIYFIGIGGIGMSAVAGLARAKGYLVAGSDADDVYDPAKKILEDAKIDFKIGYHANNFSGADLVVATAAVDRSNPEFAKALDAGIEIVSYPELLGALTLDMRRIVVTGTHGKGTTSGLIGYVLKNLYDDSFFVGAVLTNLNTNFHSGSGNNIVIEGDEYKSSAENLRPKFFYYQPDLLLINNLEFDHPDIYPNLDAIKKVFRELAESIAPEGLIVYNIDDLNVREVVQTASVKKVSFGFSSEAEYRADAPALKDGFFEIAVNARSDNFIIDTVLPGKPYAYDNLAAAAVLAELGVAPETFLPWFKKYLGVKRRYEIIFEGDITIIDDYAHHPSAVKQTLEATREKYPGRRIVCFFEPHTYSRTKETLPELTESFGAADRVFIAEVYPAREQKLPTSVTGSDVVAAISAKSPALNIELVHDKTEALQKYLAIKESGDVVIVMAVGSFNSLVHDLVNFDKDNIL